MRNQHHRTKMTYYLGDCVRINLCLASKPEFFLLYLTVLLKHCQEYFYLVTAYQAIGY